MATVIKAGRVIPGGTAAQPSQFNLEDLSQQASQYLDNVRAQAARIVTQAQEKAQAIERQAAEQGRETARAAAAKAALEDTARRWGTLGPALQQAIDAAAQLRASWVKSWEEQLLRLAVGIAQRIVRTELTHQPQIRQQWIREAVELASGSTSITLQLHPEDFATLGEHVASIRQQFTQLAQAQIVPCTEITPGGCRVITDYGEIDQRIESQLERLREELVS
jgi:flagellar assembly protein FliH